MKKEKVLVISTYPPKGSLYGHKLSAVASYAKNTLTSIKDLEIEFVVLADKNQDPDSYREGNVCLRRVWSTDDYFVLWRLVREIRKHQDAKTIFVEFEWTMFGKRMWLSGFFPLFLLALNLMHKHVIVVTHAVLLDAAEVSGQIGSSSGSLRVRLLSLGLKCLYWTIVRLSKKVVVFEEHLRSRLIGLAGRDKKIVTIPHGVEIVRYKYPPSVAKHKLGLTTDEFVVMAFGFHVWYKGTDWIASQFADFFQANPDSKLVLYLVGGPSPKYLDDSVYQNFLSKIDRAAKSSKGKIKVTGFVDEQDIGLYYAASDLVVLPYRVFVSSSGPLSLAFSYAKAFLLSQPLHDYFETDDFARSAKASAVKCDECVFSFREGELLDLIKKVKSDKAKRQKLEKFSRLMAESRSWSKTGQKYRQMIKSL